MKHFISISILLLFFTINSLFGQSVGIGTTTPDASAIMELSSTTQGFLIPRMNTRQRDAIAGPKEGLMILNLDDKCIEVYNGSSWIKNCGVAIDTLSGGNWSLKANFIGDHLIGTVGFSIADKGYVGNLLSYENNSLNFWEYDPVTDSWMQKARFPGQFRVSAVGFSINNKGYLGTGGNIVGNLADFYEYDPAVNTWTRKADVPGGARNNAVGFSIGDKGYIGTGNSNNTVVSDFWEYDPNTDLWTRKADFAGGIRRSAVGLSIGSKGYIGTGYSITTNFNDFWEYDPATDTWTQRPNFPGGVTTQAAGFTIGSKGFVFGGGANSFWEFDPLANIWTQHLNYPGNSESRPVAFSIGSKGYMGINNISSAFWEYDLNAIRYSKNQSTNYSQIDDLIWTKKGSILYNTQGFEHVGIGTKNPASILHLSQDGAVELSLQSTSSDAHRWTIQSNPGQTQFQIIDRTLGVSRVAINTAGNFGIGIFNPPNKLSVSGNLSIGSSYAGIAAPANGAIIEGHVGIGTSAPQSPLHVKGLSELYNPVNIRYFNSVTSAIASTGAWVGQSVILGEGNICATQAFISGASFTYSDVRIKDILGRSNGHEDLERLNRIKITRYKHIDSIANGNAIQTKVIAQQLKEVMPEAISYTRSFIPNVMQLAKDVEYKEDEKVIKITLNLPHTLNPGDMIKCLDEKGGELIAEVISVPKENALEILSNKSVSKLFIFGKEVDDFHIVDYDAISMLNVSATQELSRQLEELKQENQRLRDEMDHRISKLEAAINLNNN